MLNILAVHGLLPSAPGPTWLSHWCLRTAWTKFWSFWPWSGCLLGWWISWTNIFLIKFTLIRYWTFWSTRYEIFWPLRCKIFWLIRYWTFLLRQWSLGQWCWWTPRVDGLVDGGSNLWIIITGHCWVQPKPCLTCVIKATPKMFLQVDYVVFVYVTQMKYTNTLLTQDKFLSWLLFINNCSIKINYCDYICRCSTGVGGLPGAPR